jgi:AraC family transcriptional regulator
MEYVRSRRLSLARIDLLKEERIIDVAIDYGFETASGFSKAFRKEFGYSPSQYIARMKDSNMVIKLADIGGYIMNPVFVTKKAFNVAGYEISQVAIRKT